MPDAEGWRATPATLDEESEKREERVGDSEEGRTGSLTQLLEKQRPDVRQTSS